MLQTPWCSSYNPHPSHQQVLQTLPSECVWSVTLSLHFQCSLDYSSSLLTCICPHPSPPPYFLFSTKHRSDSLKNLRPCQSSLLRLPLLLGVTPGSSCSVSALIPHILTQLCSPASLLVLNPLGISPWPLHSPIPLCGAASPGLPEPLPSQICSHHL